MPAISPISLAMAVGASGAMVDVSTYLTGAKSIEATWGQTDSFRDVAAGTFTFTLDNFDGRFTPGNTLSPLATPIQEGTAVCWQAGSRLMSGSILNFAFPNSATERGRITITCDDLLGDLARYQMPTSGFVASLESTATPLLMWPLNEASGATYAAETTGNGYPLAPNTDSWYYADYAVTYPFSQNATYGQSFAGFLGQTGLNISNGAVTAASPYQWGQIICTLNGTTNFSYASGQGGYWGFWADQLWSDSSITQGTQFSCVQVTVATLNSRNVLWPPFASPFDGVTIKVSPNSVSLSAGNNNSNAITVATTSGPHYYAFGTTGTLTGGLWVVTATLYVDGVSQGSATVVGSGSNVATWNPQPTLIAVSVFGKAAATVARLGHFMSLPHPETANTLTLTDKLTFYDSVIPGIPAATISGTLSTAPIGQTLQTGTGLEALQTMARTEQGYLYPAVTGTVTSPTVTLTFRDRTRATTPKVSFDAVTEIEGILPFERHVTNLVATATASGDGTTATVTDSTLNTRASNASGSDTILLSQYADAYSWASDRINRGKVLTPYPTTVVIDAQTTPTDRSADLIGLVPGDRVSITNINSTLTGFTSWDGWLIGATESHTPFSDLWTLYLAPVTDQAVYDTSVFQPDGTLSLVSSVTASATTLTVANSGSLTLSASSVLPVTIQVDLEQMSVTATAVSGANQVLTVTRGTNSTTAATHNASTAVNVLPNALYAF